MTQMLDSSSIPAKVNGNPQPDLGSATAAQSVNFPFGGWFSRGAFGPGMLLGPGGSSLNPLNFPGWDRMYPGYTWVYDWMLRHPRIQQARSVVTSPIIQSEWLFDCDEGLEDQKAVIESNWKRLRQTFVPDALRGIDYGCAKFEVCWNRESDGKWIVEQMKPLDVDRAGIFADHGGTFTGFSVALRTDLDDATRQRLSGFTSGPTLPAFNGKAWLYTFDKKNGYLHGRSMLENIRETAWIPWLTTAQQLILLGGKISGRQAVAIVPPGGYTDTTGLPRTYAQDAQDALLGWQEGKSPVFTSLALEAIDKMGNVDPALKIKLLTETLVKFSEVDFGNLGPAKEAMLKELEHYEDLMFAGYHRSSRTGMQSKNGSRADAEEHTDTGSMDSQIIADSIPAQLQPLIDFQCQLNWSGKVKPNAIRIRQAPLRDTSAEEATKQTNAICAANPIVAMTVARGIAWKKQLATARIPVLDGVDINALLDEAATAPPTPAPKPADDSPLVQMSRLIEQMSEV